MYIRQFFLLGAVLTFTLQMAVAGEFYNLNFEKTNIRPTPVRQYGPFVDPTLAFPGWTVGPSGTAANNYTLYNSLTLGSVAQVLVGPRFPNEIGRAPLEGRYSALLQFGPSTAMGTPALIQTGLVPADARSITFLMSQTLDDARVTLDGAVIPLVPIGGDRMAGDVTSFAGKEVQLMFSTTSYNGHWLYFDDVVFSPVALPEPSVLALASFSVVGLILCRRRRPNLALQRTAGGAFRPQLSFTCIRGLRSEHPFPGSR